MLTKKQIAQIKALHSEGGFTIKYIEQYDEEWDKAVENVLKGLRKKWREKNGKERH